jgi:hypothetical protein
LCFLLGDVLEVGSLQRPRSRTDRVVIGISLGYTPYRGFFRLDYIIIPGIFIPGGLLRSLSEEISKYTVLPSFLGVFLFTGIAFRPRVGICNRTDGQGALAIVLGVFALGLRLDMHSAGPTDSIPFSSGLSKTRSLAMEGVTEILRGSNLESRNIAEVGRSSFKSLMRMTLRPAWSRPAVRDKR